MYKANTKEYKNLLRTCYNKRKPLFIAGGPGIGKSMIPLQLFEEIAKEQGLEFVRWDQSSRGEKEIIFENKDKYFVFCDQRLTQMDVTDLRGIPKMDSDRVDPMPPSWVLYFCNEDANGVIFFDEINLAPQVVQNSAYQIINDRSMADMKLGDNVYCMAAGNRAEDKAFTFELPLPLRDRFCEMETYPDVESWSEWAAGAKVNPHLISFVNWKHSYLYKISDSGADKSTTPRGIARASELIDSSDITSNDAGILLSISVGEAFATEFQAYVKYYKSLNWDEIYKNPESIKSFETSQLFAVCGGLAEHFQADSKKFDGVINVIEFMRAEFAVMTLRMMRDSNPGTFKRLGQKNKKFVDKIAQELGKFII